jgi:maleate isomerase
MRDVLGYRRKFGVIGPSTNTIVQPDFEMMRPPGVTNHYSRIFTPNARAVSNESFMAGIQVIGNNVLDAVRSVMTCEPDYLVMGMSSVTFNGGAAGADAFVATVEKAAGVLAFLDRGVESLRRRQAYRVPIAVLSRRQRRGAALFHRFRF